MKPTAMKAKTTQEVLQIVVDNMLETSDYYGFDHDEVIDEALRGTGYEATTVKKVTVVKS